jgi:hypothetical protein
MSMYALPRREYIIYLPHRDLVLATTRCLPPVFRSFFDLPFLVYIGVGMRFFCVLISFLTLLACVHGRHSLTYHTYCKPVKWGTGNA